MTTSGSRRIAERYVKALFDVAQVSKALDAVEKDMMALGKVLAESEEMRQFLVNPLVPRDHQADVMVSIIAKMQGHEITRQFLAMLARQKRLSILPDIIELFAEWVATARGQIKAEIVSAAPLPAKELALVSERIGKAYGKQVKLEVRQDPALLGGLIVKVGSKQLDSSLAGKLARLKMELKAA